MENKKNINDVILYANIKGENGREVREVKIIEMNERPCYFYFNKITRKLDYVRGCGFTFTLEIAGIGEVSSYKFLNEYKGGLYSTINLALQNDENNSLYRHGYNEDVLNISWIADIYYDDLNLTHPCTTLELEDVFVNRCCVNPTHFRFKPISYYWNGTKTEQYKISWKFKFDLVENKVKMYKGSLCDNEDKLGNLYATREMCEKANKPTIVTFAEEKKPTTKKIVTFEIKAIVEVEEDEDCDVIVETAVKQIKNAPNNTLCKTYTSIQ